MGKLIKILVLLSIGAVVSLSLTSAAIASKEEAKKSFQDSREKFRSAYEEFKKAKITEKAALRAKLVEKAREHVASAIDFKVSYLEDIKPKLTQEQKNKVDQYISTLRQKKQEILNSSSIEDVVAIARDVEDLFRQSRDEAKYSLGTVLENRIGTMLDRMEKLTPALEQEIKEIKNEGVSASELESRVKVLKDKIGKAKASAELLSKGLNAKRMQEVNTYSRESITNLKDANNALKEATGELKKHRSYVFLNGTSKLYASGSGRSVMAGDLNVSISGINGTLITSPNAQVNAIGGTKEALEKGNLKYQGFDSADIKGNNTLLMVAGKNLGMEIYGSGLVTFKGNWTYELRRV